MASSSLTKSDSKEGEKGGLINRLALHNIGAFALIFCLALGIRLWFAYCDGHETIVYSCDASEYLRCSQALCLVMESSGNIWQNSLLYLLGLLPAESVNDLHKAYEPIKGLATQAGPTFPAFLLMAYLVTASPVTAEYWYAPILIHSIFTSMTSCLIGYIAFKCWNKTTGITAGLLSALYPGFIVNSLRLYSESYATFWLVLSVALFVHMYFSNKWKLSILLGFFLGVLQGTRSALVLVTGLTTAFLAIFSGRGNRKKALILTALGMALAIAPCMVLQNLAIGKSSVVQDRVGHYNIFVGMDVNAQGWLSYPYPNGQGIEKQNYLELLKRRYNESHSRFVKLLFDKPLRLFKFPWNDFRTPIGVFGQPSQVLFHQICLLLAAIGISGAIFNGNIKEELSKKKLIARSFLILLAGLHSVYFFFITVPRYGLTAMPFVLIFASAGIAYIWTLFKNNKKLPLAFALLISSTAVLTIARMNLVSILYEFCGQFTSNSSTIIALSSIIKAIIVISFFALIFLSLDRSLKWAKITTIALALVILPFTTLPLRAHGRILEWQAKIESGFPPAKQTIFLPPLKKAELATRQSYLLLDQNNWKGLGQSSRVKVNGYYLKNNSLPLMPFSQNLNDQKLRGDTTVFYECEDIYKSVLNAAGGLNLDIRQWFILPLPAEIIAQAYQEKAPKLKIEIEAKSNRNLDLFGAYSSDASCTWLPSVARYSWEKCLYGVENDQGFTDSRFDEKYKIKNNNNSKQDLSNSTGLQTGSYNIRLLVANTKTGSLDTISSKNNSSIAGTALGTTCTTTLDNLPSFNDQTFWSIRVEGEIESEITNSVELPIDLNARAVTANNKPAKVYQTPWVPTSIDLVKGPNKFSFSFPLKPDALKNIEAISISTTKGGLGDSTQFFGTNYKPISKRSNLSQEKFESEVNSKLRWKNLKISISELPGNPIAPGFEIF